MTANVQPIPDGWQEEIFKTMDKNQVPAYFGGTLVGPTGCPKCSEWVGKHTDKTTSKINDQVASIS